MNRQKKILVVLLLAGWMSSALSVAAPKVSVELTPDSTFVAADVEVKSFKDFDVDTSKVNVINLGMQISIDAVMSHSNPGEVSAALANPSYFRQRADMVFSAALPQHTNVYATLSFINGDGGANMGKIFFTNLEIEHFFKNHTKIRAGRLANSVSESQFFGRIALEETSAHYYGRTVYINDAVEFDGSLRHLGGPVYFIGIKPQFKPLNLKAVYAGLHQPFKCGLQTHVIVSLNRQFEQDMQKYIPTFTGTDMYGSWEAELAYKNPAVTAFINVGSNISYRGLLPHVTGAMDFMQQFMPVVTDKSKSFNETFMGSVGLHLHPSKLSPVMKFLPMIGVEAELQGALTDKFTAVNVCAICKFSLTRRLVLTYNCVPQFIWQSFNPDKPAYVGGAVHFLRLSIVAGKVGRLF